MEVRINKYIADAGIASRRKAEELILNGNVKINGAVVTSLGIRVSEGDKVEVNGRLITPAEEKEYFALNKPLGVITSVTDPYGRPTVVELITETSARVFPVGRLDYDTSGLIFITNDGELSYRLTHPKHEVPKTYRVKAQGRLSRERQYRLKHGVDIGGFTTSPAELEIIRESEKWTLCEITIHEGKNREIRRMFDEVGNKVLELKRVAIGKIRLGRLAEGHYRKLTKEEIEYLKTL